MNTSKFLRSLVEPLETETLRCMRVDLERRIEKTSAADHPELFKELHAQRLAVVAELELRIARVERVRKAITSGGAK